MFIIGSHNQLKAPDFFLGSAKDAIKNGANALMVYTGAPQNTIRKSTSEFKIDEALKLLKDNNISPDNIVVHAPYIINLANPEKEKRDFAVNFLIKDLNRAEKLCAKNIVLHPGSAVGKDRDEAIGYVIEGINKVLDETKNLKINIAIETMAGKGNEVGINFDEISKIINGVSQKDRIKVCLDTCHISDAGYDIKNNYEEVLKEFDEKIGLSKISVIHLNDSKNICGARKDRHENIGLGHIGFDTLLKIAHDERFKNIPKILETPYIMEKAPYKVEIEMLKSKQFKKELFINL